MMPMNNKILVAILIASTLISAAVCTAWAQTAPVLGVKDGDNFTYSFEVLWSSNNPSVVVPQEFSDMNKTISIHFNVTSAGGTMANLNITRMMRDGTQTSTQGYVEVVRGSGVEAQLFIIGANLTAGDKAYPEPDPAAVAAGAAAESFTITETLNKTYLGTSRPVNRYTERVTNSTTGDYVDRNAYYDQATGVLLEMTIGHFYSSLGETDSEHWKIIQFNSAETTPSDGTNGGGNDGSNSNNALPSWVVPIAIAAVVVVVIALVAVMVVHKRRRKAAPQAPSNIAEGI